MTGTSDSRRLRLPSTVRIAALPHWPATLATLYERGQDRIVVILNRSHAPQTVAVDLAPGDAPVGSVRVRDLLSQPAQADACTTLLGGECMRSWDGGRAPS